MSIKGFLKKVKKDIVKDFAEVQSQIEVETDRVISDPNAFSDKGFVDQDIIDSSRLKNSKTINSSENLLSLSWRPIDPKSGYAYAEAVWFGYLAFGKKYIPGRKWDLRSLDNVKPAKSLARLLAKRGYLITKIKEDNYES